MKLKEKYILTKCTRTYISFILNMFDLPNVFFLIKAYLNTNILNKQASIFDTLTVKKRSVDQIYILVYIRT